MGFWNISDLGIDCRSTLGRWIPACLARSSAPLPGSTAVYLLHQNLRRSHVIGQDPEVMESSRWGWTQPWAAGEPFWVLQSVPAGLLPGDYIYIFFFLSAIHENGLNYWKKRKKILTQWQVTNEEDTAYLKLHIIHLLRDVFLFIEVLWLI